ncbi:MAG: hypothetical protein JO208_12760 [Alphaproteobacteria bacterium]|nr:hypothetical protein [Alphaproteobacteria bacterium]
MSKEAGQEIEHALKALAANILRVVRGAGKPVDLPLQAQRFLTSIMEYHEREGHYPEPELFAETIRLCDYHEHPGAIYDEWYAAERQIVRGSLQIVASEMLRQLTVCRTGEKEMLEGAEALEAIREKNRRGRGGGRKGSGSCDGNDKTRDEWRIGSRRAAPRLARTSSSRTK